MRYFEFITESVLLFEAFKNRYMQMFQSLPDEALAFNMDDLSEPQHGWDGYDERTAADYFLGNLPNVITDHIES